MSSAHATSCQGKDLMPKLGQHSKGEVVSPFGAA